MSFILTDDEHAQLLHNGQASAIAEGGIDHRPVVKLFLPEGSATWLLTEITPDNIDTAFGLCDVGQGFPELGYVSLAELRGVHTSLGTPIEKDEWFTPTMTVGEYAAVARSEGRIVA